MVLVKSGVYTRKKNSKNDQQFGRVPSEIPPALSWTENISNIPVLRGAKLLTCPERPRVSGRSRLLTFPMTSIRAIQFVLRLQQRHAPKLNLSHNVNVVVVTHVV